MFPAGVCGTWMLLEHGAGCAFHIVFAIVSSALVQRDVVGCGISSSGWEGVHHCHAQHAWPAAAASTALQRPITAALGPCAWLVAAAPSISTRFA